MKAFFDKYKYILGLGLALVVVVIIAVVSAAMGKVPPKTAVYHTFPPKHHRLQP